MSDRFQPEATRSVRSWGFNTFKNPDVRYNKWGKPLFQGEPGKPDMDIWGGGRFTMIEVKDGYDSFAFANFEQNKRDYVKAYCTPAPYYVQVWIWLSLGNGYPNWKPEKQPRITWLIPYQEWCKAEEILKPIQVSIPYLATENHKVILRERRLDAVHIFERFVLKWEQGMWAIPPEHPFAKMYIEPKPLPLYKPEVRNVGVSLAHTRTPRRSPSSHQFPQFVLGQDLVDHDRTRTGRLSTGQYSDVGGHYRRSLRRSYAMPLDYSQEWLVGCPY